MTISQGGHGLSSCTSFSWIQTFRSPRTQVPAAHRIPTLLESPQVRGEGRRAGVRVTGRGCGGACPLRPCVCVSWAIQAGMGPAWANVCHHTHLLKVYLITALSRKSGHCDKRRLASLERGWSGHTQEEGDASPLRRRHLIHDGAHVVGTAPSGVVCDQPTRPCTMGRVQSPAVPSATQLSDLPATRKRKDIHIFNNTCRITKIWSLF